MSFYLENNQIFYDDLALGISDSYSNNFFVGTCQDGKTKIKEKCNFGNFRIPYSKGLDIGTGDFGPSKKYFNSGWQTFIEAYNAGDAKIELDKKAHAKALAEEKRRWWQ